MAFTTTIAEVIAGDKTGLLAKHPSWERVPLSEVASILNGAPFDSSLFSTSQGFPLIRIRDVVSGTTSTFYTGPIDETFIVTAGEILVGMDGDFNTGFWGPTPALLNQRVCKITPNEVFYSKKLLSHVLPGYLAAINSATPSITVKHLSSKTIAEIELPLPPHGEQTRIVEKLEELLSDLDAGVAELKAGQTKLVRYRQSLLKAAVEGALTAEWRQHNTAEETGTQLLQRILTERRARWEAKQLAKFAEQGKAPPKDWQKKYPEPVQPDTAELPELPEGWVWASLDQLSLMVRNGLSQKPSPERIGIPILRINAVRPMAVNLDEVRYLALSDIEANDYFLDEGDLLATRYNGSVDLLGVFGVVRGIKTPTVHPDKLIRIKPALADGLADWIEICSCAGASRKHLVSRVKTTAGQTGISGEDVKKMPIPLAPHMEQAESIKHATKVMLEIKAKSIAIETSLKQSTAQRKNILRAAFSGQLVPQDPNDEPASALLARIRAGREQRAVGKAPRRRKESA